MSLEKLSSYTKDFVEKIVIPEIHPELIEEMKRHKKEKRILVLNTASPDIYPSYIAEILGFDYYRATNFILTNPLPLFIPVKGSNNKRTAKLFSMIEILPEDIKNGLNSGVYTYDRPNKDPVIKNSWSYSDSSADLPMLYLSENPVLINPLSMKLRKLQKEFNWRVLKPGVCQNPICTYFRMIRQLFGLYKIP
jgi:phosphoserine phosphatase